MSNSQEFTGEYYKCNYCQHVWDYMDSACPECGSGDTEDFNIDKEIEAINDNLQHLQAYKEELLSLKRKHK